MSVYLICVSNNLDKQAVILAEDYKKHRDMFKELQTKMSYIQNLLNAKEHRLCHVVRANCESNGNPE